MDFSFSEEQLEISKLANKIIGDHSSHERLRELETADKHVDDALWRDLASAGLLGLSLPDDVGGAGLGFFETYLVLVEVGRHTALAPVLPTLVLGALPIAEFGTPAQKSAILPGVVSGESVLTAALVELARPPQQPATTATRTGGGWTLDGEKTCVPAGLEADRILVPAATGDASVGVFLVDPNAAGVTLTRQDPTNGIPEAHLELNGVQVSDDDVLGDAAGGDAIVDWIVLRANAAQCAVATGLCEEALRRTAEYTKTREQFGRPIATFQAVGQRAADAFIDTDAVRLTGWQAAWRLSAGRPAAREVAIAKFWAADGGQRVVHAAQHLHGGIGIDLDYPLHRYFLWAKHTELSLGGGTAQLLKLGNIIAAEAI